MSPWVRVLRKVELFAGPRDIGRRRPSGELVVSGSARDEGSGGAFEAVAAATSDQQVATWTAVESVAAFIPDQPAVAAATGYPLRLRST